MRSTRRRRGRQGAQASLEMALVLPIMLTITIGFIGVMLELRAQTEFQTAVDLAAQASIVPPLGQTQASLDDERYAFSHTLHTAGSEGAFVTVTQALACAGPYLEGDQPVSAQGIPVPVTCSAGAEIDFSHSPIGMLWFWKVSISARAEVQPSIYRGCLDLTSGTACAP
ncbi:MAG TPA: hypothetical protein VEK76_05600 [Candidatus Binatia bacterium]|nr:hypothetical protein [Candidatus Binatia bacterium]